MIGPYESQAPSNDSSRKNINAKAASALAPVFADVFASHWFYPSSVQTSLCEGLPFNLGQNSFDNLIRLKLRSDCHANGLF